MDDLDLSKYIPEDLNLRDVMLQGALAAYMEDTGRLMLLVRKWGQDVTLHTTDDGWCLHIDHIFGEEHGVQGENLNHLLLASLGHVCKHHQHLRDAAKFN